MYAVIADHEGASDTLRHVFFAESATSAAFLAREIAEEDGLRVLILKVIDAVDPALPHPVFHPRTVHAPHCPQSWQNCAPSRHEQPLQ